MIKVVYTATAARQIESQIAYLISQNAEVAAHRARNRISSFIANFLCRHPKASTYVPEKAIYETWIPRTKYVLARASTPSQPNEAMNVGNGSTAAASMAAPILHYSATSQ